MENTSKLQLSMICLNCEKIVSVEFGSYMLHLQGFGNNTGINDSWEPSLHSVNIKCPNCNTYNVFTQ